MRQEEWRVAVGFPDYAVSSFGRVRRVTPDAKNHKCRILKPWIGNHGYEVVSLAVAGDGLYRRLVHRLVCEAFHGPAPSLNHQVAHGDGTRRNNHAENLRWASRAENMGDCVTHGTRAVGPKHGRSTKPERTPRGERHGHAKLSAADIAAIRAADRSIGSGVYLASKYGVSTASISIIRSGKTWRHILGETGG